MAPNYFQKPEAALKRAEELIQVGKEADALDTLHDTIKARRHKQWTTVHEQIMIKHMELCVDLKKQHLAKDALFQYKALTQQINVKSLETVVEHFLKLAEQRTVEAQKQSKEKVEEIGDLDQGDVPERLLLAVVSGAAAQDRMDRTVLAPWLRFLWDSYRNCLELLRNNAQVEHLYHTISRQSFEFCVTYQRRTEFRKLCDLLRMHLNQIQKHQYAPNVNSFRVKLTSPESLALMQDTRLNQLDTAIKMELWQEAYKSAEDVHGMMQLSKDKDKRTVKPSSYVNYYDKLSLVFLKAGNSLFHAAALLQKFIIYKDMRKQFTQEEAQEQATRVLLATLSIPEGSDSPSDLSRNLDIEEQHVANMRLLSNLLRLPIAPTKNGILKEAARIGLPEAAGQVAKDLFRLLESNFSPLRVAKDVQAVLDNITREDHLQYVESLQAVAAVKALKQVSVIYETISWDRIRKIIPFYSDLALERLVVEASKHRIVKAQLDHRADCVRFGSSDATLAGGVDECDNNEGFTGDDTQLGVEGVRNNLESMYTRLRVLVEGLDAEKRRKELLRRIENHVTSYEKNRPTEIERIHRRKKMLENYKENWERVKAEKTAAAATEQAKREEAARAEEMKRLDEQNKESERKRKQAEQEEIQKKIKQDQLYKMQQNAIYQAIIKEKGLEQFRDMDPEQVLREQRERLDKERAETQRRLQQQEKNFDHHVRALHLEEMVERRAVMSMRLAEAPKIHAKYEEERIAKETAAHEQHVKLWGMWDQVRDATFDWVESVKNDNKENLEKKISEWEAKLEAVRNSRLAERAEKRKKERKEAAMQAKIAEERKKREEEERARQAVLDGQRRPHGERRPREPDNSAAMQDNDWRRSAPPRDSMPPRDSRPMRGDGPSREPFREQFREAPSSKADTDSSWRSSAQPTRKPDDRRSDDFHRDGPRRGGDDFRRDDRDGPRRSDDFRREPPRPTSKADTVDKWERGVKQAVTSPPQKTESAAPAPADPKPEGPRKFIPPALRNKAPTSEEPRGNVTSPPDRSQGLRGPPPPQGPRNPLPPRRHNDAPSRSTGNADSGNWRS
uniref:Eukaryotic translation initiation factor 3 subunit A n=1 Tax=Caenorhabditis tropicalis TaxID=1561998 RepID=A0A1I7TGY0_9PELO